MAEPADELKVRIDLARARLRRLREEYHHLVEANRAERRCLLRRSAVLVALRLRLTEECAGRR